MPISKNVNFKKDFRGSKQGKEVIWVGKRKVDDRQKASLWKGKTQRREATNKAAGALRAAAVAQQRQRPKKQFSRQQSRRTLSSASSCTVLPFGFYKVLLYQRLRFLWFFMLVLGQLPFFFWRTDSTISIRLKITYPFFWMAICNCVSSWFLFLWMCLGMFTVNRAISDNGDNKKCIDFRRHNDSGFICSPEEDISSRFWVGYWLVWFIFFHLAVSSTEFVFRAKAISKFLRELLDVVQVMQIDVTRRIIWLLVTNLVLVAMAVGTIVGLYFMRDTFPWAYAVSAFLIQILVRPIWSTKCHSELFTSVHYPATPLKPDLGPLCAPKRLDEFAPYGLCLIIYAIIASRLYSTYFMTMCRIFSNALHVSARRMEMSLQLEPKTEDAKRLDFDSMFNDYYSITSLVHRFNVINGFSVGSYFFIQLLGFLMECFIISRFFGLDAKKYYKLRPTYSAYPPTNIHNESHVINIGLMFYMHIAVTFFSCMYISSPAAKVNQKVLEYNGVLYRRGIVGNREPHERDFVRTLWMNCSHRNRVIISPAHLFGITSRFMMSFLGATVIFLILMFPIPLLEKYANWANEEVHMDDDVGSRNSKSGMTYIGHSERRRILKEIRKLSRTQIANYLGDLIKSLMERRIRGEAPMPHH